MSLIPQQIHFHFSLGLEAKLWQEEYEKLKKISRNPAFLSASYQHREDAENHRISIQA